MAQRKKWSELTPGQRVALVVGGVVQLALMVLAQRDLSHRTAGQVRGPKWMWRGAVLVNFVGPVTYFVVGRKKPSVG